MTAISVFLADDNLLIREGVKMLISLEDDLEIVGVASDYEGLVDGACRSNPQVVVTDIRMPPDFRREGIDGAKEVRRRHPGTGIVILSQYDDPEYAVSLLSDGAAGYGYLLKDRIGEGDQLVRAIREVASGGSVLDPLIVESLTHPISTSTDLEDSDELLLRQIAEGKPIKAIAVAAGTTPADIDARVEALWIKLANGLSAGNASSLERIKLLHRAIVDREEQGESLSRLLPGGVAARLRARGGRIGETEELEVTVLMSDIRGYTSIAERTDPSSLARQLNEHRAEMNRAIIDGGGTVMQFVGDAVMAVFGAPDPTVDHADRAVAAARHMHRAQRAVNDQWIARGLEPFGLGIGLSTGKVAAALLGSEDRLEYSLVGDTVNLTQRLQQWAEPGETIMSDLTRSAVTTDIECAALEPALVKGRSQPVAAFKIGVEV